MQIGQRVLAKVNGQIEECIVEEMKYEDVVLNTGKEKITRKYWEVRKLNETKS